MCVCAWRVYVCVCVCVRVRVGACEFYCRFLIVKLGRIVSVTSMDKITIESQLCHWLCQCVSTFKQYEL